MDNDLAFVLADMTEQNLSNQKNSFDAGFSLKASGLNESRAAFFPVTTRLSQLHRNLCGIGSCTSKHFDNTNNVVQKQLPYVCCRKVRTPTQVFAECFLLCVPATLKDNLKCVLAPQNERLVIAMCELNALADQPPSFQTVKKCIELGGPPERSSACGERFFEAGTRTLTLKQEKMLSSARVDTHIVQETEQFIDQWGKVVESNRILKFNVVVFDETVAGDPTKLSKVVESRDKGAARVCRVC